MTRTDDAVLALLAGRPHFQSAQEIYAGLRAGGRPVGLASVYRAVQRLRDAGGLDEMRRASGEAAYRRCPTTHHHHLTCEQCGTSVELQASGTEQWVDAVAREHGFLPTHHVLEVTGLCPRCQPAGPAADGSGHDRPNAPPEHPRPVRST